MCDSDSDLFAGVDAIVASQTSCSHRSLFILDTDDEDNSCGDDEGDGGDYFAGNPASLGLGPTFSKPLSWPEHHSQFELDAESDFDMFTLPTPHSPITAPSRPTVNEFTSDNDDLHLFGDISSSENWNSESDIESSLLAECPPSDSTWSPLIDLNDFNTSEDDLFIHNPSQDKYSSSQVSLPLKNHQTNDKVSTPSLQEVLNYVLDFHSIHGKESPFEDKDCVFRGAHLPSLRPRQWIIDTFTSTLCYLSTTLRENDKCSFMLPTRRMISSPSGLGAQTYSTPLFRTITYFKSRQGPSDLLFVQIVLVISYSLDALQKHKVVSKRDVYYKNVPVFQKQSVVDRIVDNLASMLGVSRQMLNITAAAKGLARGACAIEHTHGLVEFRHHEGSLIHRLQSRDVFRAGSISWILVVEKEACFRSLAGSSLGQRALCDGLIVTGKGYPDVSTRAFLHKATSDKHGLNIPAFALVDLDPDGLLIYLTYKYGSRAMRHENKELIAPSLQWLGPRFEDVLQWIRSSSQDVPFSPSSLISMSARDRKKAVDVLRNPVCREAGAELDIRQALQLMLVLNMKAEIQSLETRDRGLDDWVKAALRGKDCSVGWS